MTTSTLSSEGTLRDLAIAQTSQAKVFGKKLGRTQPIHTSPRSRSGHLFCDRDEKADPEDRFSRECRLQPSAGDVHTGTLQTMNPGTDEFLILPELTHLTRVAFRLVAAALLGGLLGAEREWVGKAAGLRTHMLVSLGAALFVLAPAEAGLGESDTGRVIQGIAAGIGFIGAGTILKRADREEIQGLTTAASIWLTAAIGVAAAVGPIWLPVMCVICALLILYVLGAIERRFGDTRPKA